MGHAMPLAVSDARIFRMKSRSHAVLVLGAACAFACAATACQPSATVGSYDDGGVRCDPLDTVSCPSGACTLRADPAFDGCRSTAAIAVGEACTALDQCVAGAQCARIDGMASLDPADLLPTDARAAARCAAICARDVPTCAAGERCLDIATPAGGVRLDFGLCAP